MMTKRAITDSDINVRFTPIDISVPTVSISTSNTDISYVSIGVDLSYPVPGKAFSITLDAFSGNGLPITAFDSPVTVRLEDVAPPDGIPLISPDLDAIDIMYSTDGTTWQPHSERAIRISYNDTTNKSVYVFQTTHFSYFEGRARYPAVPCFPAGTRVLTAEGFKAIETLRRTDRIVTPDGRTLPFRMSSTHLTRTTTATAPYLIPAHAFGRNSPPAPVTLSPNHAIQMRAGLWQIPAVAAKLYPSVRQVRVGEPITYYHIQLPNYFTDNIVVEGGVVAESYAGKAMGRMEEIYTYAPSLGGFTRRRGPVTTQKVSSTV